MDLPIGGHTLLEYFMQNFWPLRKPDLFKYLTPVNLMMTIYLNNYFKPTLPKAFTRVTQKDQILDP